MKPDAALAALREQDPERYKKVIAEQRRYAFKAHSAGQDAILRSPARFVTVRAGRRYGKTKVAARKLISHGLRNPGVVDWWIANTYKNTRRGYREVLRQLPPKFLAKPAPPATANDLTLVLGNGTRLEFYSGTNPDAMAGEGVGFVVMDEAALQNEVVWTQTVRPTLMDSQGGALLISTPRGRNWFWKMAQRGDDPLYPGYASFHFPTSANPLIPDSEIAEARESLPEIVFKQEILAEFIAGTASIFAVPDSAVLEAPLGFERGEQIVMGVDLAKSQDFTVITAARGGDRQPVFHDRFNSIRWPEQRDRIRLAAASLEERGATVSVVMDTTGVGDVVFDDLEDEGMDVVPIKFTNEWKTKAVKLLASDLEQGKATILADQLPEFESYEYTITDTGRYTFSAPSGGHDDEVSAKLLEHWGLVNETLHDGIRMLDARPFFADDEDPLEAETEAEEVYPRTAEEMMNDPSVWA